VPPLAVITAEPFVAPLHDAFVGVLEAVTAVGFVKVTVVVAVHPLAAVTVTLYVPVPNPVIEYVPPLAAISVPVGFPEVVPVQLTL
jgi:hypothetical protein